MAVFGFPSGSSQICEIAESEGYLTSDQGPACDHDEISMSEDTVHKRLLRPQLAFRCSCYLIWPLAEICYPSLFKLNYSCLSNGTGRGPDFVSTLCGEQSTTDLNSGRRGCTPPGHAAHTSRIPAFCEALWSCELLRRSLEFDNNLIMRLRSPFCAVCV